ncbi:MAG: TIGR00282 family metallophosphoesterase [Candidatus Cloacimonadaceae bacterium]|nr:TIGR00282 family metallophosphoesterase [Candidatus Cloacimonadaceae bacterium]MDP3114103.1 TIGR00282 family metallophosphoesterase [Candidatus Cloacimonadaceae bacterium]
MRVLFFGDIFGKSGRKAFLDGIGALKEEFQPDFVIVNGENIADGKGLTEHTLKPLLGAGVDAISGGNHLWDRAESHEYIRATPRIVKPLNYPDATPGNSYHIINKADKSLGLICLTGQMFMPPSDSPFAAFDKWYAQNSLPCVLLDFHAESTAEKRALGWHVDGRISAVVGTHTHIQTADEEILPGGTAYITDVGMTGPHDSVIGIKKSIILEKFTTCVPIRYEVSDRGLQINAVYIEIDEESGKSLCIKRIRHHSEYQSQG